MYDVRKVDRATIPSLSGQYLEDVKPMTPEIRKVIEDSGYFVCDWPPTPGTPNWQRYQQGLEKGRADEASRMLSRLMQRRFGTTPAWVENRLSHASLEQIGAGLTTSSLPPTSKAFSTSFHVL